MNDLESIKKSIVNGLGISILSSRSVNDLQRTKQILVFPLEESAHKRSFYIVYSKNRILKPHVKQFVQFARDIICNCYLPASNSFTNSFSGIGL